MGSDPTGGALAALQHPMVHFLEQTREENHTGWACTACQVPLASPSPWKGTMTLWCSDCWHSSIYKKIIIYFNWRPITLQYCGAFCHTLTWISHGCTCVPALWTPLLLPSLPHPIPSGLSLALSALLHSSNLHWSFILHMIVYMFQCYSLKSSHPCLLSQSPKVCSLHLCLFCYLAYMVGHYMSCLYGLLNFMFICVNTLYWCFSFWLTSLCIIVYSFIHLIRTDSNAFFFVAE